MSNCVFAAYLRTCFLAGRSETYIKPVEAAVLNLEHTPYAVDSPDDFMRRVIQDEWPHEFVLAAIAPFEAPWK